MSSDLEALSVAAWLAVGLAAWLVLETRHRIWMARRFNTLEGSYFPPLWPGALLSVLGPVLILLGVMTEGMRHTGRARPAMSAGRTSRERPREADVVHDDEEVVRPLHVAK